MFNKEEIEKINNYYNIAFEKITNKHISCFKGHEEPVFLISETYPGVWLEHVYDSIFFAKLDKDYLFVAKNTLKLFLDNQKENGQLPCYVIDKNKGPNWNEFGYSQTQECVSFASLCLEYFEMSKDYDFLEFSYEKCVKWINWYKKFRMTQNKGLIETFCGYDTGHDNSGRWENIKCYKTCADNDATKCIDDEILPLISPDMNAVYYGNLIAVSKMAELLGNKEDSKSYKEEALKVRKLLFEICYDKNDDFFYDVDKKNNKRKYLSISISNIFSEKMLEKAEAELIYNKHLRNDEEFWTNYPFPSMAKNDNTFKQNLEGNSWGFYSQALTILRCTRWMDYYGKSEDFNIILEKWIRSWTFDNEIMFGQELHPLTGKPSKCSQWYSSCMLLYIYAVRRLGII